MTTVGWTVDTLATHIERQLEDMRAMLKERYESQTKAVGDAFIASSTAVQAALAAADRAAVKAELAADKRFEVVTEKLVEIEGRMNLALKEVTSRLDVTQGRTIGFDKSWSWLMSLAAAGVAIYGLFH